MQSFLRFFSELFTKTDATVENNINVLGRIRFFSDLFSTTISTVEENLDVLGRIREEEANHREHLNRVAARWRQENHTVHFGPVCAVYLGDSPDRLNASNPDWGALGLAGDWLWFVGESSAGFEIKIPLSTIPWVSWANLPPLHGYLVTVYREKDDEWRLHLLGVDDRSALAQAIQTAAPVTISTQPDYGPTQVVRMRQNMLGQWQRDYTLSLYLAPDRLLAGWHTAALLAGIRELAVLTQPDSDTVLLRINSTGPDGAPQVIGFEMKHDQAVSWGDVLRHRTGVTVDYTMGRKKK